MRGLHGCLKDEKSWRLSKQQIEIFQLCTASETFALRRSHGPAGFALSPRRFRVADDSLNEVPMSYDLSIMPK